MLFFCNIEFFLNHLDLSAVWKYPFSIKPERGFQTTGIFRKTEIVRRHVQCPCRFFGSRFRHTGALALSFNFPSQRKKLSLVSGQPVNTVQERLAEMQCLNLAVPTNAGWVGGDMSAHLLRNMAVAVRTWIPDSRMPHNLGALLSDSALEECEGVVKYLDEKLRQQSEEDILCLEWTVQYLLRWGKNHVEDAGEKSSRYAELVLIVQNMYTFEKAGFPPVPQYPFVAIIEKFK